MSLSILFSEDAFLLVASGDSLHGGDDCSLAVNIFECVRGGLMAFGSFLLSRLVTWSA